ncbi:MULTISPECIES: ShlB/FhaC/HecB family hemolysin secretion/activation protein [Hydrocarboniphaga]|uniref:ShlB/FhaC/HecB family hemolysin secretion/activation protein n=1 Tax=Hydrocarboniphaga TaxID=243627 RepID=UPI0012F98799|nr:MULTISPECIES: POTRA domain-containing protein [Hydrocarboniphaga]MDZ4079221.1 ShlB/FhaC/HecB family hemolysin secretion/activation protein [Hydrocarboniphaga sp.]
MSLARLVYPRGARALGLQVVTHRIAVALLCTAVLSVEAADPAPAQAQEKAAPGALDIWEFAVDGNTVLDEDTIAAVLQPFMGEGRTPEDVDAARADLEKAYRERGYKTVSVSIPRQTVAEGVVTLQVTEGRIGHLNVIGSRYHSIDRIREQAPALAEGTVPNFNDLRDDIVRLNSQADRRVTPALKAGARPGTIDVDLAVSDDLPLHGSLELNNRQSQDTSELRSLATLSYGNLWQRGHSLSLSYQTAPRNTDDAKVFFGSYLAPFSDDFSLLFNGLKSDSNVATVGGVGVVGAGKSFGVRGVWTLPSPDDLYQSFTAGIDYKRFRNTVSLSTASFDTPATYYPISGAYTAVLRQGISTTQVDLSLNFASQAFGSDTQELQLNRAYARGQMFYVRGSLEHNAPLPASFEVSMRLAGQWTDQPLITNEQLNGGGLDTGRGYLEAESLGDYGFMEKLEVLTPELADTFRVVDSLRFFAFFDGSLLRLRRNLPETPPESALLSTGVGLNLQLLKVLNGSVVWAMPLDDGPATQSGDSRWLFRVWGSF